MINSFRPFARKDDLVTQDLADELLVYDLESKQAHCLNATSALVWQYCDGKRSLDQLVSDLNQENGMVFTDDIVLLAIAQLESTNLLVSNDNVEFPAISRREIIKKAGFAIAVALPLISTIAVPSNVAASTSGIPPGGACTASIDCQSGLCVSNVCV